MCDTFKDFILFLYLTCSFKPFLNEESYWQYTLIAVIQMCVTIILLLPTGAVGAFFVNICFYIEFLIDLFQKKFNETDTIFLNHDFELVELKINLKQIIKLQTDIRK